MIPGLDDDPYGIKTTTLSITESTTLKQRVWGTPFKLAQAQWNKESCIATTALNFCARSSGCSSKECIKPEKPFETKLVHEASRQVYRTVSAKDRNILADSLSELQSNLSSQAAITPSAAFGSTSSHGVFPRTHFWCCSKLSQDIYSWWHINECPSFFKGACCQDPRDPQWNIDERTLTNPAYTWSDNEYQFLGISTVTTSQPFLSYFVVLGCVALPYSFLHLFQSRDLGPRLEQSVPAHVSLSWLSTIVFFYTAQPHQFWQFVLDDIKPTDLSSRSCS